MIFNWDCRDNGGSRADGLLDGAPKHPRIAIGTGSENRQAHAFRDKPLPLDAQAIGMTG